MIGPLVVAGFAQDAAVVGEGRKMYFSPDIHPGWIIMLLVVSSGRMETTRGIGKGDAMGEPGTATIQTAVPIHLLTEMEMLVEAGWFRDLDELMLNALRRFVESHRPELMEGFIR